MVRQCYQSILRVHVMLKKLKKYKILIGIILSLLFLYLAFMKISWKDMEVVFSVTSFGLLAMVIIINLVARIVIVFRWKLLLSNEKKVGFKDTFNYMNIGYFINSILPARTGDFVKAILLAKKNNISKTSCIASVALERLFDMMGLGMVFLLALIILKLPVYIREGGFIVIILVVFAILFLVIFHNRFKSKKVDNVTGSFPKIYQWVLRKIELVFIYTRVLRITKTILMLFLSTMVIWYLYIFIGYLIANEVIPVPGHGRSRYSPY